jgi:hypothetical protein
VKDEKRRRMKKTEDRNPRTGEGAIVALAEVCCHEQTEQSFSRLGPFPWWWKPWSVRMPRRVVKANKAGMKNFRGRIMADIIGTAFLSCQGRQIG